MTSVKLAFRRDASRAISMLIRRHSVKRRTAGKTNLLRLPRAARLTYRLWKVRILIAGVFLLTGLEIFAQCPTGAVALRTQQDVDNFAATYPNCTNLPGSLLIGPLPSSPNDPIIDLALLSGITQINGELRIGGNTQLANLNGLENLISINLGLVIQNNDILATLNLPALTSIGGVIQIQNNPLLTDFDLSGVSTHDILFMKVQNNASLTSALLPTDVTAIAQYLSYYNNPDLDAISPMESLATIGQYLEINNFTGNTFPAFSSLTSIGLNLNDGTRGLYLGNNSEISALPSFDSLNFISGGIIIDSNDKLTDFDLSGITTDEITRMDVLNNAILNSALLPTDVTDISQYLRYYNNPLLVHISEMDSLVTIGDYLQINSFIGAPFPDFSSLTSIGLNLNDGTRGLFLDNTSQISALPLFNSLNFISGAIVIAYNDKLTDFDLSGITTDEITRMDVQNNASLISALLPTDVTAISQYLRYYNNPLLVHISEMDSLVTIGNFLRINSFIGAPFPDFSSLTSIGLNFNAGTRGLFLDNTSQIGALPLFNSLNFISGTIVIAYNDKLTDFDLSGITTDEITRMDVQNNAILNSALLPTDVTAISQYLQYFNNPLLAFLSEMDSLTSIGEYLTIDHTIACSLPNFPTLTSIGPQTPIGFSTTGLFIRGNQNITALPTLSNSPVTQIDSIVQITNNPLLDYCSIAAVCGYLQGTGPRIINNNAGDCLDENAVDAACVANLPYPSNDMDGDGVPFCDDCDDNDPNNFPGNTEICDGQDNNCDGQIDEGIQCDCEVLAVALDPLDPMRNDCCWAVSYDNPVGNLWELAISSGDAHFDLDRIFLDTTTFKLNTFSSQIISVLNALPGEPLPAGALTNFLSFCLKDVQNTPQRIVFDWLDSNYELACSDTLLLECPVEPECLYLASDTIYCDSGNTVYNMTVCNPIDNAFSVRYIEVTPSGPAGIVATPPFINETNNPIDPGECRTYTFNLSGANIAGESFCFNLQAHSADPNLVDTALCCSLETTYCIPIPDCDPCDNVGVAFVEPLQTSGECCYDVYLFNNYDSDFFDGIDLCALSPNTTMGVIHSPGSIWETADYSPTAISLDLRRTLTHLPEEVFKLPELCFQTEQAPPQLLEIKWRKDGEIVCRDTVELGCEPDCGYLFGEEIRCNANGSWTYQGNIQNTSDYVMNEATFAFTSPPGMSAYNQTVNLGAVAPNGSRFFRLNLDSPAMPGDTVCFTVALHEQGHDGAHRNCCNLTHCIVLPECPAHIGCRCDADFHDVVQQGFSVAPTQSELNKTFTPDTLTNCDLVYWSWGYGVRSSQTRGMEPINHTFPGYGTYGVCMTAFRTDLNGRTCNSRVCRAVTIGQPSAIDLNLYPNPADGRFNLKFSRNTGKLNLRLYDLHQRLIKKWQIEKPDDYTIPIDIGAAPAGVYLLELKNEEQVWLKKVIVQ